MEELSFLLYFELDVKKYNINELKNLFKLQDPYTIEEITEKEEILKTMILNNQSVEPIRKSEIFQFLMQVRENLINEAKENFKNKIGSELKGNHNVIVRNFETSNELNPIGKDERYEHGVARHTINKLLCLDSQFRDNYYNTKSTNFQFTLPTIIKNVISMELVALELPTTFYQVSIELGNNYFWLWWKIDATTAGQWFFISIADGNYTRTKMAEAINKSIGLATQSYKTGSLIPPLFIIDEKTNRSIISPRDPDTTTQEVKLAFNRNRGGFTTTLPASGVTVQNLPTIKAGSLGGIMSGLGWILGYRLAEYKDVSTYTSASVTNGHTYISEGLYDCWSNKYIYIILDDFNKNVNNYLVQTYTSSLSKSNILARLSINPTASSECGITLSNTDPNYTTIKKRTYFGPVDIKKFHFSIIDAYGRILNLNNMDCSIGLNLVCLYDH